MDIDLPGFADPVADAQATFRAVLDAMARPGQVRPAGGALAAPAGLDPATAALLLTLADIDTGVHLAAPFAGAADWVRFHCGAPLAAQEQADFVVAASLPDLAALRTGTDDEPQGGATVLLQVPALAGGRRRTISGPGLREPARLCAQGLPEDFAARWGRNHALFPRGVDLVLCAGASLLALPRSLCVSEG